MEFLEKVLDWLMTSGVRLVLTIIVSYVLWKLVNYFTKKWFGHARPSKLDPTLRRFLSYVFNITLKIVILILAINFVGIDTSAFVALLAAAGATVGLALQGGLSNFAGGVILIIMHPFKIDDYISNGSYEGTVKEIGLFYTTVITVDNRKVFIPNGSLTGSTLVNVNCEKTRRLDMQFKVAYDTDIKKLRAILTKVLSADGRVLTDPAAKVIVAEYGDSSVTVEVRMWTNTENYWDLKFEMQEMIKSVFDVSEIVIPYNQLDVHMK